ncbi:MAG: hypothetical protein ABJK28_09855 [Algibacter sp.]
MFKKLFKKKKTIEINFDQIDLNLSDQEKESITKFSNRTDKERMGEIMVLGDKGDQNFFYLIHYAVLYDSDLNVRFAALKRIPNFQGNPNFDLLINNLSKSGIGENLEPYYSMMLFRLGKISETDLNNKLNNEVTEKENRKPLKSLDDARAFVQDHFKNNEETLWIADELNDPIGMNMAIVADGILKAGYIPDGFDQKDGYRIYKYNKEN